MASITIRNLDDNVKKTLRKQAAENGRSLEAEVRDILTQKRAWQPPATASLKPAWICFAAFARLSRTMAA